MDAWIFLAIGLGIVLAALMLGRLLRPVTRRGLPGTRRSRSGLWMSGVPGHDDADSDGD